MRNKISRFGIGLLFLVSVLLYNGGRVTAERLISTSAGLDFSQVHVVLNTEHDLYDRFYSRALDRLSKAGLKPRMDAYKEGNTALEITLRSKLLNDSCQKKRLYSQKLELKEKVAIDRNPKLHPWVVTWSYGVPEPYVVDAITVEKMEKDLDELIDAFLTDYRISNPKM